MLSAREAKKKTDETIRQKMTLERNNALSVIENLIVEATGKGESSIQYSDYFDGDMDLTLSNLGYKVEQSNNIVIISW